MINPQKIFKSAEYKFWTFITPRMNKFPKVAYAGYQFLRTYRPMPFPIKALFWITLGWTFGLGAGLISAFIF